MALTALTFQSIAEIDAGRIAQAITDAIERAHLDCRHRPALAEDRVVTLQITIKPQEADGGGGTELSGVDVRFHVAEKLPKRSTRTYNMLATDEGLLFNELSPAAPQQRTLDESPVPAKGPRKVSTNAG